MPCPLIIRLSDGSGFVFDPARHDLVQYLVGNTPPNYPVPALLDNSPEFYSPQRLVDYASMRMASVSYAGY